MAADLGIWELIRAREVRVECCTEQVKALLSGLTLEQLFNSEIIRQLAFFAKTKLQGLVLPVRALYDGETHTIGINYLRAQMPLWYAGPDLAAARIDGNAPEILEAFRLVPVGIQDGLKDKIRLGKRLFHPKSDNFFTAIIEERQSLKQTDKHHPHVLLLKIIANALYGCFAELNTKIYSRRKLLEVFSGDDHGYMLSNKVEFPGKYSFIPAASLITSAGRLALMMFEKRVEQAGGYHAMTDTDSVIVVASESGGLVPCENGPERMPGGRSAIRALTWKAADEIAHQFDSINPFNPKIIPHLFKKEDVNFSADGKQKELRYFGISSKRYACFRGDPCYPQILKPSQHGVGCYFKPDSRKRVQAQDCLDDTKYPALAFDDWRYILRQHFSSDAGIDATHPFLNQLAMRKVRINTPRELAWLRKLDPRKARPFSFCISPIILEDYRYGKPVLIAPMTDDPSEWIKLKYVDVHTGKSCYLHDRAKEKIVNGEIQTDRKRPLPQLYSHALTAFYHHPESKYPGGDRAGLLGRWHVHENDRRYLGKEVERKVQAGDSLTEILEPQPLEYKMRADYSAITKRVLHPAVIQAFKEKFSARELAKLAKLNRSVIIRALGGRYIQSNSWRILMRLFEGLPS